MAKERPVDEAEAVGLWVKTELDYVWGHKLSFGTALNDLAANPLFSQDGLWGRLMGNYWHQAGWWLEQDEDGDKRLEVIRNLGKEVGATFGLIQALGVMDGQDFNTVTQRAQEQVEGVARRNAAGHTGFPTAFPDREYRRTGMFLELELAQEQIEIGRMLPRTEPGRFRGAALLSGYAMAGFVQEFQDFAREPDGSLLLPEPGHARTELGVEWA